MDWIAGLPPEGIYAAIAVLAALENIVPPVPADTAVALGAFLAARGVPIHPTGVFAVTFISNVSSALAVFIAAHRYGRPFFATGLGRKLLSARAQERIAALYERHHLWGIFVSRFLPGYRAVVPPFAGIAGLTLRRVVVPIAGASAIYYGVLVLVVYTLGENWDAVVRSLGTVGLILLTVALAATIVATVRWRRAHRDSR